MKLNLDINRKSSVTITQSFDRIAKDLMENWKLNLQGTLYSFTEIEFYYFDRGSHPDKYSHKHNYMIGKWRFHLQGLDISLGYQKEEGTEEFSSYGGILLRGIKSGSEYINGPKRILAHIFKALDSVEDIRKEFGMVEDRNSKAQIFKSIRKGLSERYPDYNTQKYRYFHSIESWNMNHVPLSEKKGIVQNSVKLKSQFSD